MSESQKKTSAHPVSVKDAVYTCPVCNEQILIINANTLSYLSSHVAATQDNNGMTTLTMQHPGSHIQTKSYNPGEIIRPNQPPFFVVDSMSIETLDPTDR
ncbi:hypothetical protein [Dictyobacter aurantiacus]|uniref:Uncharacterized protein n=1 Tax=Dictyobacter aurantiacus TaxID=1936993 RepID=A0A401ZJD7_9CHLR|nr:hypothetical protein [Dictyobacter aurantiacus]GCE06952.1 hypothetical protein KDAU_42810 [Dictyobacter aurantiacus]